MPDNRRTPPRSSRPRGRSGPRRVPGSGRAAAGAGAGGAGAARGVRPASARGGAGGGAVAARRPRFTGRAAVLVLVLAVLAISYASSMRAYLQQRGQIGDLKDQIALRR